MYLFKLWSSPGVCRGMGLLGHMVALFLAFLGTFILFSIVVVAVHIPSVGGVPFILLHGNNRYPIPKDESLKEPQQLEAKPCFHRQEHGSLGDWPKA